MRSDRPALHAASGTTADLVPGRLRAARGFHFFARIGGQATGNEVIVLKDLTNKTVLVVGMARSGEAAAQLLLKKGARVVLNDSKPLESFNGKLDALIAQGAQPRFGCPADQAWAGCDMMVISPGISVDAPFVRQAQAAGIAVTGELELGFTQAQGLILGVTGTNGKTTTTTLVGEIFKNAGKLSYLAGNIGIPLCQQALAAKPEDVIVVEISSFQMETADTFHPHCCALLNITEDHLNRHGTMQVYTDMKFRAFANMTPQDFAIFNYDDPGVRGALETRSVRAMPVWFSVKTPVPYGAWLEGDELVFGTPQSYRPICRMDEIRIPGMHNVSNALAAAAMAAVCAVQLPVIRYTLRTFAGVEHRIEFAGEAAGVRYINDSKGTNVDSTIKAVQTMQTNTVLMLGGYDKHTDFDPLTREILANPAIGHIVVYGDTRSQIEQSLVRLGYAGARITRVDGSFESAVRAAREAAHPGDTVLLSPACASFDQFDDYEQRGRVFKDLVKRMGEGTL